MAKMEQSIALPLMDAMICVVMSLTGLIAGIIHRSGFCVAGRGAVTTRATIYDPGIAATAPPLSRTTSSDSVVPGQQNNFKL